MAEQDQTQTEEIQTLYAYIGKLHRALCTTMDLSLIHISEPTRPY
mgnify:CR=1 FL=1